MEPTWSVKNGAYEVQVFEDHDAESPRIGNDNLGTIIGYSRSYNICDITASNTDDYSSWNEWKENELPKDCICLPVYAYIHGGIRLSITSFNVRWDSGQVGFIYTTRQQARENFMVKRLTKEKVEHTQKILESEIIELDSYFNRNHYCYDLLIDGEVVDRLSGFMSGENMVDDMAGNWPSAFNDLIAPLKEEIG